MSFALAARGRELWRAPNTCLRLMIVPRKRSLLRPGISHSKSGGSCFLKTSRTRNLKTLANVTASGPFSARLGSDGGGGLWPLHAVTRKLLAPFISRRDRYWRLGSRLQVTFWIQVAITSPPGQCFKWMQLPSPGPRALSRPQALENSFFR